MKNALPVIQFWVESQALGWNTEPHHRYFCVIWWTFSEQSFWTCYITPENDCFYPRDVVNHHTAKSYYFQLTGICFFSLKNKFMQQMSTEFLIITIYYGHLTCSLNTKKGTKHFGPIFISWETSPAQLYFSKCFCTALFSKDIATKVGRSRPEVFCKKVVLRNFTKFTGKHLCQNLFF